MDISEILKLSPEQQITALKAAKTVSTPDKDALAKQWNPRQHDVFDATLRPDKRVRKATGETGADGRPVMADGYEPVNRIAVPFQRIIVNRAVGFILGNPVRIKSYIDDDNPQQVTLAKMVEDTLDDNKSRYFDRKLARTVKSECEAAELWYPVEDPSFWRRRLDNAAGVQFKLRVQLLSPSNGDTLYPAFDDTGDLVAFSRAYQTVDGPDKIDHFDTWTQDRVVTRTKTKTGWEVDDCPSTLGKIPVIYYHQDEPDWATVQPVIDRFEKKLSNFGDTNDYFGSPMVKVKGQVRSLPDKTSQGKVLQLESDADASYMSWDQSPESEKLEFEILEKIIYAMTQTPNISFAEMQAMGGEMSGFAIKLLFTDAHLKAENDIEIFGEMYQRRLNLLRHILGKRINTALEAEADNVWLEPVFTPYLPKNNKEEIEILATARGNKPLISRKTAAENNPLVGDVDAELDRMQEDADAEAAQVAKELTGTY